MPDTSSFIVQPPRELLPWLTYTKMLTNKLEQESGDARLHVLKQKWSIPNWWDKYVLRIDGDVVLHREILMYSRETSCWYARTIIPKNCYFADEQLFDRLATETLGDLIFGNPDITRKCLVHYPLSPELIEYYWINDEWNENGEELWARKSAFTLKKQHTFYLIEILLPGLLRCTK